MPTTLSPSLALARPSSTPGAAGKVHLASTIRQGPGAGLLASKKGPPPHLASVARIAVLCGVGMLALALMAAVCGRPALAQVPPPPGPDLLARVDQLEARLIHGRALVAFWQGVAFQSCPACALGQNGARP